MTGSTCIHEPSSSSFTSFSKKTVMRIKEVKDLLSLCFQKDIMCPEREREHPRKQNHSPDQIGLQHPKSKTKRNVLQKTKSCTRPNWSTALKIPEQRGNALRIINLNNKVPSEHQNHICLLHI